MLALTLLTVSHPYLGEVESSCDFDFLEFVKTEDRFVGVRNALKMLNKMDFDKLIVSVRTL